MDSHPPLDDAKEQALLKYAGALCRARGTDRSQLKDTAEYAILHFLYTHMATIDTASLLAQEPPPMLSEILTPALLDTLLQQRPENAERIRIAYADIDAHSKGNSTARDMLAIVKGIGEDSAVFKAKPSIITLAELLHEKPAGKNPPPPTFDRFQ